MRARSISCFFLVTFFFSLPAWAGSILRLNENVTIQPDTYSDNVVVVNGSAEIDGKVIGNVVVMRGNVALGPRANVGGDVVCLGGKISARAGAVVTGSKVEIGGEIGWKALPFFSIGKLLLLGFLYKVATSVIMLFLALFLVIMWPNQIRFSAEEASADLVKSSLVGVLAVAILIPLGIGFAITLFGLPIFLALAVFLLVAHWFGVVTTAYLIGHKMLNKFSPLSAVVIGFLILKIVHFVPFLGGMLYFIAVLPGLGAVLLTRFGTNKPWLGSKKFGRSKS